MPRSLTRVSEVLRKQLKGVERAKDSDVATTCPTCGTEQTLDQAPVSHVDMSTIYTCKNGCQPVLIVADAEHSPREGRGYRLGPYVLRNPADLLIDVGAPAKVKIPAAPNALETN